MLGYNEPPRFKGSYIYLQTQVPRKLRGIRYIIGTPPAQHIYIYTQLFGGRLAAQFQHIRPRARNWLRAASMISRKWSRIRSIIVYKYMYKCIWQSML